MTVTDLIKSKYPKLLQTNEHVMLMIDITRNDTSSSTSTSTSKGISDDNAHDTTLIPYHHILITSQRILYTIDRTISIPKKKASSLVGVGLSSITPKDVRITHSTLLYTSILGMSYTIHSPTSTSMNSNNSNNLVQITLYTSCRIHSDPQSTSSSSSASTKNDHNYYHHNDHNSTNSTKSHTFVIEWDITKNINQNNHNIMDIVSYIQQHLSSNPSSNSVTGTTTTDESSTTTSTTTTYNNLTTLLLQNELITSLSTSSSTQILSTMNDHGTKIQKIQDLFTTTINPKYFNTNEMIQLIFNTTMTGNITTNNNHSNTTLFSKQQQQQQQSSIYTIIIVTNQRMILIQFIDAGSTTTNVKSSLNIPKSLVSNTISTIKSSLSRSNSNDSVEIIANDIPNINTNIETIYTLSIPWENIHAYTIHSDCNTTISSTSNIVEYRFYTNMMNLPIVSFPIYKSTNNNNIEQQQQHWIIQKCITQQLFSLLHCCTNSICPETTITNVVHDKTKSTITTTIPSWFINDHYFKSNSNTYVSNNNNNNKDVIETLTIDVLNDYYHNNVPILLYNENIDFVIHGRRYFVIFTKIRILVMEVKHSQGVLSYIDYKSLLWSSIVVYGIKLAGSNMDDSSIELLLYTSMMYDNQNDIKSNTTPNSVPGMSFWELDCTLSVHYDTNNPINVPALHKYMTLHCCPSYDTYDPSKNVSYKDVIGYVSAHIDYGDGLSDLFQQLRKDHANYDTLRNDCEKAFHTNIPILLPNEQLVHYCLQGRGDYTVFTNLRTIEIDTQGWSDQRIVIRSIPYQHIRAVSITTTMGVTSTSTSDNTNNEIQFYTGNLWSLQKFRFRSILDKDVFAISTFISSMILLTINQQNQSIQSKQMNDIISNFHNSIRDQSKGEDAVVSSSSSSKVKLSKIFNMKNILTSVTDTSFEVKDVSELNDTLQTTILIPNESIQRLFQCGRDYYIYTNYRLILMDVQGISIGTTTATAGSNKNHQPVVYTSFPYQNVTGYTIVTCNAATKLDRDAELYLYCTIPGRQRMKQSILMNSCDICDIHMFVSSQILH